MRTYGYDLGWYLVFELGLSFFMVMVAPVGSPLGYSINMLLGMALFNYFVTWEGYLVGVSFGPLDRFMIVTGKVYLVGLSLGLPLGYQLESPNPGRFAIWHADSNTSWVMVWL